MRIEDRIAEAQRRADAAEIKAGRHYTQHDSFAAEVAKVEREAESLEVEAATLRARAAVLRERAEHEWVEATRWADRIYAEQRSAESLKF